MRFALEVRGPFMDHELVGFAAGLGASQLLRGGGKRLLRQAFKADLPPEVFTRPKMGFAVRRSENPQALHLLPPLHFRGYYEGASRVGKGHF